MHDPQKPHLQAAYRVLRYLKGTSRKGILFKWNNSFALEAYIDADYVGPIVDRRSITGYCTFVGGNLVIRKMWWLDHLSDQKISSYCTMVLWTLMVEDDL